MPPDPTEIKTKTRGERPSEVYHNETDSETRDDSVVTGRPVTQKAKPNPRRKERPLNSPMIPGPQYPEELVNALAIGGATTDHVSGLVVKPVSTYQDHQDIHRYSGKL